MTVTSPSLDLNSFISDTVAYQPNVLTLEDHETIQSVLSNYDSENLTQNDASQIVASFQDAGIEPSRQLSNAMSNFGFDAQEIGQLANQSGQAPLHIPPTPINKNEENDLSSLLEELLSNNETEDEEETSLFAEENVSDYTSRILNLNNQSKDEAMNIIEKYNQYNQEDSPYSKEDIGRLLTSSLDTILNDSNNYNRVALFA